MQFSLTGSQRYLVNANADTNHSANPTNPNGNRKHTQPVKCHLHYH